jgi:hypothetical protein
VFASRVCSTVRQFVQTVVASRPDSRGATRATATLSRFRENRKSRPCGTSSRAGASHRIEDHRRLQDYEPLTGPELGLRPLDHLAQRQRQSQRHRLGSEQLAATRRLRLIRSPSVRPRASRITRRNRRLPLPAADRNPRIASVIQQDVDALFQDHYVAAGAPASTLWQKLAVRPVLQVWCCPT